LRSRRGAYALLLDVVGRGLVDINLSVPLLLEYEAVLKRPGKVPMYTSQEIDEFLDDLCVGARECRVNFLWRPQLTDLKDEAVLELAVAAGGAPIVTYNKDHYRGAERFGVRIITALELLYEIGALEQRRTL
jgi:predicted nucleic acid-binding protein